MKALEILKNLRKAFGKHDQSLEEAIVELEALEEENEHLKRMVEAFKKENK